MPVRNPARASSGLLAVLTLLTSCGDGSTGPEPDLPDRVSLTPPAAERSWIGASRQLVAQVLGQSGQVLPTEPISWSSSDPAVASVTSGGLVEATGPGQAAITAASGSVSHSAAIIVVQAPRLLLKVSGDSQTGEVLTTLPETLIVEVRDEGGTPIAGTSVLWSLGSGGGMLMSVLAETDADGLSSARWMLGDLIGTQGVTATAGGYTAEFTADATPPPRYRPCRYLRAPESPPGGIGGAGGWLWPDRSYGRGGWCAG